MIKLFFSYSHKDEALRDELATHLAAMKRQGVIDGWHDRRMLAGDHVDEALKAAMEEADVVLLLVSPDFIASDYCYDVEMTRAVQRHAERRCRTIPVILRPCDWHGAPFGKLLAMPRYGKAVTLWRNLDEAFLDAAKAIRAAAEDMRRQKAEGVAGRSPETPEPAGAETSVPVAMPKPRLRLSGPASDAEKDDFMEADHFIATIYVNGAATCRCKVWHGRGGMMRGINYSENQSSDDRTLNESLGLEQVDGELRLKAMGFSMVSGSRDGAMDPDEAGAFYWSRFIRPLC